MFKSNVNLIQIHESNIKVAVSKSFDTLLAILSTKTNTEFMFYADTVTSKTLYYVDTQYVEDINKLKYEAIDVFYIPYQELIIPRQKASYAEVEPEKPEVHQLIGHKHPSGVTSFSSIDEQYLLPQAHNLLVTSVGIQEISLRIQLALNNIPIISLLRVKRDNIIFVDDNININNDVERYLKELKDKVETPFQEKTYKPLEYEDYYYYYETDSKKDSKKKKSKKEVLDDV